MKFFGHPLHMLLIHFPTALLPMDTLLSFFTYYTKDGSFLIAAFYCLEAGVLFGGLALLTGFIDMLLIPKEKKLAVATAMIHGFINTMVLMFLAIFAYKSWQVYPRMIEPERSTLLIKTGLIIALFSGNYFGGKLILQHRIGVLKEE